jgi:LPS export ABC transporter protein LptC
MRNVRFALLGVVALVIGLSVYYIVEGVRRFQMADDFQKGIATGVSLNKIHLVEKISAEDELELTAITAEVDDENDKVSLKEISLVYNAKDHDPIHLTADRGVMSNRSKDIFVEGNVLMTSEKGVRLTTQSLTWNNQKKELDTEERIRIEGDRFTITGIGLRSKVDEEKIWIKNSVNALFY